MTCPLRAGARCIPPRRDARDVRPVDLCPIFETNGASQGGLQHSTNSRLIESDGQRPTSATRTGGSGWLRERGSDRVAGTHHDRREHCTPFVQVPTGGTNNMGTLRVASRSSPQATQLESCPITSVWVSVSTLSSLRSPCSARGYRACRIEPQAEKPQRGA